VCYINEDEYLAAHIFIVEVICEFKIFSPLIRDTSFGDASLAKPNLIAGQRGQSASDHVIELTSNGYQAYKKINLGGQGRSIFLSQFVILLFEVIKT
jgi:hypothetical protein